MKKIIAVLVTLAVTSATVFSAPIASEKVAELVLAGYEGNDTESTQLQQVASLVDGTVPASLISGENYDLFAAAAPLTDTEAVQVEGGAFPWIIVFVVGALVTGLGGVRGCDATATIK